MYKQDDILLSNPPKLTDKDYPNLVEFLLEQEGVEVDTKDLEQYATYRTVEIPVKSVCPNCQKKTTLFVNKQKNLFFCKECEKGGGVVKAMAFYSNRTMKEVINDLVVEKVHPLLRLSAKQVAFLGYSASDIRKLEAMNDFETMSTIYNQWRLYEECQLAFTYALYLLASIRKNSDELMHRLTLMCEYAQNVRIRSDYLSLFMNEFMMKSKYDELKRELQKPNIIYEYMQRDLIEESGVFISLENVIKMDLFDGEAIARKEWALQGEQYARQAFNRSIQEGDKALLNVERHLFELRDYKRLRESYKNIEKVN